MNLDASITVQEAAMGLLSLSPTNIVPLKRKKKHIPPPSQEDAINCICGSSHDDGFSIACDDCSRWYHAVCVGIVAGEVPEVWKCSLCDGRQPKKRRKEREDVLVVVDDVPPPHIPLSPHANIIPSPRTRARLDLLAASQRWRGISAITPWVSPVQTTPHDNIQPPYFALHTTSHIPASSIVTPFTSTITPTSTYLADPLNAYAHLGLPKPFVHLLGPPLDVALDARMAGDDGRWVRSGCKPNAVLKPVLCDAKDKETLGFAVFATRDLHQGEEVVLGWEWDDSSAIHHLPALLKTPGLFPPAHKAHLRAQMANMLHLISSTFPHCACGEKAADCAFNAMQRFVAESDHIHTPDLGPLVGTTRGFKTRERVPGSGGLGGVEMDDEETEDELDARFRPPRPPDPPPLDEMPPKNQMRRRWMRNTEFVPTRDVVVRSEPLRVRSKKQRAPHPPTESPATSFARAPPPPQTESPATSFARAPPLPQTESPATSFAQAPPSPTPPTESPATSFARLSLVSPVVSSFVPSSLSREVGRGGAGFLKAMGMLDEAMEVELEIEATVEGPEVEVEATVEGPEVEVEDTVKGPEVEVEETVEPRDIEPDVAPDVAPSSPLSAPPASSPHVDHEMEQRHELEMETHEQHQHHEPEMESPHQEQHYELEQLEEPHEPEPEPSPSPSQLEEPHEPSPSSPLTSPVSMRSQSLPRDAEPPDTPLSPEPEPEIQIQVVEPEPEPEPEREPTPAPQPKVKLSFKDYKLRKQREKEERKKAEREREDDMDVGEETTTPTTTTNVVAVDSDVEMHEPVPVASHSPAPVAPHSPAPVAPPSPAPVAPPSPAPVAPPSPAPVAPPSPPPHSPSPPSPSPPLVAPVPLNGVQDNPWITALPPLPPPRKSFSPPVPVPSPALASLPPKPACPTPSPVFNEPHLPLQPLTLQAKTEILDHPVPPVKVNGHARTPTPTMMARPLAQRIGRIASPPRPPSPHSSQEDGEISLGDETPSPQPPSRLPPRGPAVFQSPPPPGTTSGPATPAPAFVARRNTLEAKGLPRGPRALYAQLGRQPGAGTTLTPGGIPPRPTTLSPMIPPRPPPSTTPTTTPSPASPLPLSIPARAPPTGPRSLRLGQTQAGGYAGAQPRWMSDPDRRRTSGNRRAGSEVSDEWDRDGDGRGRRTFGRPQWGREGDRWRPDEQGR
ncbi:hypothetical protein H0H92_015408 [Tricholoma furcatifolium]|nr:hypothetical protein H0H92_015408 [Tricholoma furcatifolium]